MVHFLITFLIVDCRGGRIPSRSRTCTAGRRRSCSRSRRSAAKRPRRPRQPRRPSGRSIPRYVFFRYLTILNQNPDSRALHHLSPRHCHSSWVDPSTNPRRRPTGRLRPSRGGRHCNRHRRRLRGRASGSTSWTPAGWSGRNREDIQRR